MNARDDEKSAHIRNSVGRGSLYQQAKAISSIVCSSASARVRTLRLQAILAAQEGRDDVVLASLTEASLLAPSEWSFTCLGESLSRKGCRVEAIGAHLRAVQIDAGSPFVYRAFAGTLRRAGWVTAAIAMYLEALQAAPDAPELHAELGDLFLEHGKVERSDKHYSILLKLVPDDAVSHLRMGNLLLRRRGFDQAALSFRQGLELNPHLHRLWTGLGQALIGAGRMEEAYSAIRTALNILPKDLRALRQLTYVVEALSREGEAVEVWLSLGNAALDQRHFQEAEFAFHLALAKKSDSLRGRLGLGRVLSAMGKPAEAIPTLKAALAADPTNPSVADELGKTYQMLGDFEQGWKEWQSHASRQSKYPDLEHPEWDGADLDGRTILVWGRGVLGDSIMLFRYLRLVHGRGGRVIVECQPRLIPLVKDISSVDSVVAVGAPLPQFDVHCRLARLPLILDTHAGDSHNRCPYLVVNEQLISTWRNRLEACEKISVGISWGGNAVHPTAPVRFVPLRSFEVLADIPGVRFVSLQLGPQTDELLDPLLRIPVEVLQDGSCSLADTAALILNLDLVITVDTMIAHLTGALGRPVWTALAKNAAPRWSMQGDATPLYPTMRLFRQLDAGGWSDVFARIRTELMKFVALRRCTSRGSPSY